MEQICKHSLLCTLWLLSGFLSVSFSLFFFCLSFDDECKDYGTLTTIRIDHITMMNVSTTYTIQTNVLNVPNIQLLTLWCRKSFSFFFVHFSFILFSFDRLQKRNWNNQKRDKKGQRNKKQIYKIATDNWTKPNDNFAQDTLGLTMQSIV